MPPWPSTPVTSYRPRTTSPTLQSVSTAGGDGTASAIVGRGATPAGASSSVGAGPAGRATGTGATGSGARKDAWQRPQRTVRPATVAGALAFAPHDGQVTRSGGRGGEAAIRAPAAALRGNRRRSRTAGPGRRPRLGPPPRPAARAAPGRAAAAG